MSDYREQLVQAIEDAPTAAVGDLLRQKLEEYDADNHA